MHSSVYLPIRLPYFNNQESNNADDAVDEDNLQMQIDPPTLNEIDDIDGLPEMGKRKSSLAKHSSIKSIKQK